MRAHALAEDRCRDAARVVAGLRQRLGRAGAAAAERRGLGERALARGEEVWGLALLDAAVAAERAARDCQAHLAGAERRARELSARERARRADLYRELCRFLAESEGRQA
jgi:hypothetical protein